MAQPSIDWPAILGPLLSKAGISPEQLPDLEESVFRLSPRAIRIAPQVDTQELPFTTERVPWFERGAYVDSAVRPGGFLNYIVGDYYIQDAGSLLPITLADIQPGQWVCDVCASPGGKSTAVLEQLEGSGLLVSNEVIHSRTSTLQSAIWRTGQSNQIVLNKDVEVLAGSLSNRFDCVIVDAPCSGQSMLARGKQSLSAFTAKQVDHSAARQYRILEAAAQLVRPGGKLVYSTCTFAFAENEQIIERFLGNDTSFQSIEGPGCLDPWKSPYAEGCYRLWPHRDHCAGGFAAVIYKGQASQLALSTVAESQRRRGSCKQVDELPAEVAHWFDALPDENHESLGLWQWGRFIHSVPRAASEFVDLSIGSTPIAEQKNGRWEPAYASSVVRNAAMQPKQQIELSDPQAVDYAAGLPIRGAGVSGTQAWSVVQWQGRPLSWGKLAAGVLKNHFPKMLRQNNLHVGNAG